MQFEYDDFYKQNDIHHFYIIVAVKRYDNVKYSGNGLFGRWISEREFSLLLGVSEETFRKYIKTLIKQKKIFKLTGKKNNDSNERDKNRYRTIPFPVESKNTYENRYDGNQKLKKRKDQNRNVWGDEFPF